MNTTFKMAVAACGLVGSISFNSGVEAEYLEDDELFGQTSTLQTSGWSWGLSSAHAHINDRLNRNPGGCIGTLSCGVDQSNDDGAYEDALWERYDNCMDAAQTPQQEERCEEIVAGL